jgi:drug/metabolite transporter (DMT)-like permease
VATLVIITVAMLEVVEHERIGEWTGVTLIIVSALAVLITRPGDRSLPAMMPPLAFLTAVVIAGQQLLSPSIDDTRQREAVMIVETLGANAAWVVAATVVAVVIALLGHLVTKRSGRRAAEAAGQADQG